MGTALLAGVDFADLRSIAVAGLVHSVTLDTLQSVRGPGARYINVWVTEAEQQGLLTPASAGGTNIRADQPSAAGDWVLAIRSGRALHEGQRALVRGETNGEAWQRLVEVSKVLFPKPRELRRRALCVDADLSP